MRVFSGVLAAAALASLAGQALAQDHEAGVALTPAEAVGPWTLQSGGHAICVLHLGGASGARGGRFAIDIPAPCARALPPGVAAWATAPGGMTLLAADGRPVLDFDRWSNSLLASDITSGFDVQLRRGGREN